MADVVKERCKLDQLSVPFVQEPWMNFVDMVGERSSEMVGSQGMSEAVVGGSGEDILACRELLNGAQALEFRRVDDGGMSGRNQYVAMDFIPDDPVPAVHGDAPLNCLFIALLRRPWTTKDGNQ
jgi:hypothetical protein